MKVIDLAEVSADRQTAFLLQLPEAMLYHTPSYRGLLVELLGCRQLGAAIINDAELIGIASLMQTDGPHGRIINSLPFYGSHGGLLTNDDTARHALAEWFCDLVSADGVAAATVIGNPLAPTASIKGFEVDYTDQRVGQLTPLNLNKAITSELMASLHSKTRNMIRKAVASGIVVSVDNTELTTLATIHGENMQAISAQPKPDRFFELIPYMFRAGDEWQCWVGRKDGNVVAALLVFYFNGITEYFTPVVCKGFRNTQALSLVIFEAMLESARRGMRWWNWGGTWQSQESVHRFKSRWGTIDMPYHYSTVVKNQNLYSLNPTELLTKYPYFYVLPFGALSSE